MSKEVPGAQQKLLRMRLLATDGSETNIVAVVPFPKTYVGAQVAATEVFAQDMKGIAPGDVCLSCAVKDKKGDWLWADFNPRDWSMVMEAYNDEVGVVQPARVPEYEFVQGEVILSYGQFNGHSTKWTTVRIAEGYNQSSYPTMDRPKSYTEAVSHVKKAIISYSGQIGFNALAGGKLDGKNIRFYAFSSLRGDKPSTDLWTVFPSAAYTDDDLWRTVVPKSGNILGFAVE